MAISVGSVEVDIIPNTRGITARLRNALVPAATAAGDEAGRLAGNRLSGALVSSIDTGALSAIGARIGQQIGQQIAGQVSGSVRQGIMQGGAGARRAAGQQGSDTAGAFARTMQARLRAAFQALPRPDVRLSTTGADADLARLRARLETLSNRTIGVDLSEEEALRRIRDLDERLRVLGEQSPSIAVQADTAAARAQLALLRQQLGDIDDQDPDVRVDVDTDRAHRALTALTGTLGSFGRSAGSAALSAGVLTQALGTVVPLAAGLAGALAQAAPAAGVAATGLMAMVSAGVALKVGMSGVGDAVKAAFDPSDPEAFAEAMKKLSPNARAFVTSLRGLKPQLDSIKSAVQERLFEQLGSTLKAAGTTTLPIFRNALANSAGALNLMGRQVLNTAAGLGRSGALGRALSSANIGLRNMAGFPATIVQGLVQVGAAAGPAFERLTRSAGGALDTLSQRMADAFASGRMQEAIENAFSVLRQFGAVLGDALGTVGNILKAASDSGGQLMGMLGSLFAELRRITAMPEVQSALQSIFAAVTQVTSAIGRVIGSVVQAVLPLLAQIAPVVGQLATALGPVLAQLATSLGRALMPIVQALLPVVQLVGRALVQIVASVTPLLAPIGQLIASIISALMPVLGPMVGVITQLVQALVGPLSTVIGALVPAIELIGSLIGEIFTAISPLLGPLVDVIGQLAQLFADVLAEALGAVVQALTPLIPPLMQLATDVLGALQPVLPVISQAIGDVAKALVGLLPPIAGVVAQLTGQMAPIIRQLSPILAQVAGAIATGLAAVLPPLTGLLVTLVGALRPVFPLLAQIVGMVVRFAADVLVALMPALRQLINAGVKLLLAVSPILPIVTELITLVVRLAVKILMVVLPPILRLAGFLLGALAKGLSVVIGWVGKLFSWVADKLGPVFRWLYENVVRPVWNKIQSRISEAWNTHIRPLLNRFIAFLRDTLGPRFTWLRDKVIVPVWNRIKSVISTVWNSGIRPTFNRIKDAIGAVRNAFKKAVDAIGRIWNGLRNITKKPVNFVIEWVYNKGVRAVYNSVAGLVGADKLKPVKLLAAGGTVGPAVPMVANRPTAIVGEGNPRWPEFVIPSDPKYRSRALALWQAAGAQLMAEGGILGKIWGGIKAGIEFLADPGRAWEKATRFIRERIKQIGSTRWARTLAEVPVRILALLKDKVSSLFEGVTGSSGGVGRGVRRWSGVVLQALRLVGQPASLLETTLRRMNQESGGNPTAVNRWDINWQLGHPSVGLMQVIRPTFQRYAGPFRKTGPFLYGVSVNPLANVVASMRYALARYGSLARAYNRPGGYDSGGWLPEGLSVVYNGTGQPEPVLTAAQWRSLIGAARRGGDTVAGFVDGQRVRLVVDGHEFSAYVDARADGRVAASNQQLLNTLRGR